MGPPRPRPELEVRRAEGSVGARPPVGRAKGRRILAIRRSDSKGRVDSPAGSCDPLAVATAGEKRPAGAPQGGPEPGRQVLQGTIERVTYADERTLYTVLRLSPEAGSEVPLEGGLFRPRLVTAVGRASRAAEGLRVRLVGSWQEHRTHGRQFTFETLEVLPPIDAEGLVRYLASDAFPGIGPTLARRIVERLGPEALERIEQGPEALAGVRGLSQKVAERLVEAMRARMGAHRSLAFLRGLGLGPGQAAAVLERLGAGEGADIEGAIRADPYEALLSVPGIGFAISDRAAAALGIAPDDPRRLRAGLVRALENAAHEGHVFLPRGRLLAEAERLLGGVKSPEALEVELEGLARARRVEIERAEGVEPEDQAERVYTPAMERAERGVAERLAALLAIGPVQPLADAAALARAERAAGIELSHEQRAAVLGLLSHPLALLTGGPGVGKTTIVRQVVALAEHAGARIELASPTGRAAKRLAEATGREARTIHRLLGFDPHTHAFEKGDGDPLEADLVVVDEVSMLDLTLAHALLRAVQPPTRLVLVGDPDQLPSVGPGNVLSDLITSGRVPLFRLERVYRQTGGSLIVENAHRILRGLEPRLAGPDEPEADFFFFPADSPRACADRLIEVVTERIPRRFGFDWVNDVQVIAPMYRGECGVDALNERLREALGAGGREVRRGEGVWRVGDRVIQIRNDYDKEIFNGDMGRIRAVDPEGGVIVAFPEREVVYNAAELSDLQPAFAITVHRSQGGEFPAVVLPILPQHTVMLQRNLLYTAITRGRRLVVIVGSRRALARAIANTEQQRRESALAERLVAAVEGG